MEEESEETSEVEEELNANSSKQKASHKESRAPVVSVEGASRVKEA